MVLPRWLSQKPGSAVCETLHIDDLVFSPMALLHPGA
jgi:hypothetical protein